MLFGDLNLSKFYILRDKNNKNYRNFFIKFSYKYSCFMPEFIEKLKEFTLKHKIAIFIIQNASFISIFCGDEKFSIFCR